MAPLDLHYVTMTNYDDSFKGCTSCTTSPTWSTPSGGRQPRGKTQLRMAETEKYPHVTFF